MCIQIYIFLKYQFISVNIKITSQNKNNYKLTFNRQIFHKILLMQKSQEQIQTPEITYFIKKGFKVYKNEDNQLGGGQYGKVYRGQNMATKEKVAVKMLAPRQASTQQQKAKQQNQIQILKKIQSQNVVKIYQNFKYANDSYIVMQLCQSTLQKMLQEKNENDPLGEKEAIQIFKQISIGYLALANQNIVHRYVFIERFRDLKPANILIKKKEHKDIFKIADFGQSTEKNGHFSTHTGSITYRPPDISQYTQKFDIYSLGVILFQLIHGHVKKDKQTDKFQLTNINDKKVKNILTMCLQDTQSYRISVDQFFNHPFFEGKLISSLKKSYRLQRKVNTTVKSIQQKITKEKIKLLQKFSQCKFSKNQNLNFEQFKTIMKSIENHITDDTLQFLFQYLNLIKDGLISLNQIQFLMENKQYINIKNYFDSVRDFQSLQVCFDQKCKQNPFICTSIKCECKQNHLGCNRTKIKELKQNIVNQKQPNLTNQQLDNYTQQQYGGTSYAHATSSVIHMVLRRIRRRNQSDYLTLKNIRESIISHYGRNGADTSQVLMQCCPKYHLRCRKININQAKQAIIYKRPVVARFRLTEKYQWPIFSKFYKQTPKQILSKEVLDISKRNNNLKTGGHAVVLVSYDQKSLKFMNSWGTEWGDSGFFKIADTTVLDLQYFDVYWQESDLTQDQREYIQYLRKNQVQIIKILSTLKQKKYTCPLCKSQQKLTLFTGTLQKVFCPKCIKIFNAQRNRKLNLWTHNQIQLSFSLYINSLNS